MKKDWVYFKMDQFSNKVQQYLNASWEDDEYGIQSSETVISAPYFLETLHEFQKVNGELWCKYLC